jgi:predicted RNase H-like HicB family nuclease
MTMPHEVEYTVLVHDEGAGSLWGEVAELPGCFTSGRNLKELWEALGDAIGLYLSTPDRRVEVEMDGAELAPPTRREVIHEHRISVRV